MKALFLPLVGLAAGLFFTGCQTTAGKRANLESNQNLVDAINRNTDATVASGLAGVTGDVSHLDKVSEKNAADVAATNARYKQLRDDLEKQKLEFSNFVNGALGIVGEVATELVPGGTAAARVLGVIKNKVDAANGAANQAQDKAAGALAEAEKQIKALKEEVAAKEKGLKDQLAAEQERQKRELEFARKELSLLSATETEALRSELVTIAKENGVANAEGMTTEELLAALGAGGIGLAGLLRTFGKSRSQSDIDQLWDKQSKLEKDLANVEGKVTPS